MSESKKAVTNNPENSDLDRLLDSALEDFDKYDVAKSKKKQLKSKAGTSDKISESENQAGIPPFPTSAKAFQDELRKLANSMEISDSFSEPEISLQETIKKMAEDTDKMREGLTDEEMNKMFDNLRINPDESGGLDSLIPMMEGMMQSLLSKDLLYPAIKEMNDKYPDWLADNRSSLSETDFARYNKQYEKTRQICHEFERTDPASQSEKNEQFQKVMALMQEMQELGQPPKELIGEVPGGLEFDAAGNPVLPPGLPNQCVVS